MALMLVAKYLVMNKQNGFFFLFILLLFIIGGSFTTNHQSDLKPSYSNDSGYKLKLFNAIQTVKDSNWIQIKIRDKNYDFIRDGTQISIGCKRIKVVNGQISFLLRKIDVAANFRVTAIGYYSVETEPLFLKEKDSVVIDFVLGEDNRPLINCP